MQDKMKMSELFTLKICPFTLISSLYEKQTFLTYTVGNSNESFKQATVGDGNESFKLANCQQQKLLNYSRTSVARTLMACLPRLFRTRS